MKSSGPFKALLVAGVLAAPLLAFNAKAITYTDVTWNPYDVLVDPYGNPMGYALWNDSMNWSGGNVPSIADPTTGNPDKLHFTQQFGSVVPCVIDNFAAQVGAIAMGDWGSGHGSGTLILTNGASLQAGFPAGEWTGVGFPEGNCQLYIGTNCTASFGSHLWVGNGTNSDGTANMGTIIVDGGTLNVMQGQLGLGWNGTGGTNYMYVTNNARVNLRNWDNSTLGYPGNSTTRGILDISAGGSVVIGGNATGFFQTLVNSGQLTAYGGAGTVTWSFDPGANTTTLVSVAPVTVDTPVISTQPINAVVLVGGTTNFSVSIGNVPCNYRWFFNSTPLTDGNGISGSQTANLTVANVSTASAGVYSVYATNANKAAFFVHSAGASLSTEAFSFYPVITITGVPGNVYEVDYTTSLTPPVTWTPLTTLTLGGAMQQVVDTASPLSNKRFYRVVQH